MPIVLPTSRVYSGAVPVGKIYKGATQIWEPGVALTHPTIVGTPSVFPAANTAATSTTIVIPTPAGAAIGEGLVVCATSSGQSATDLTLPSGWARIGLAAINDSAVRVTGWLFHKLTATPAASYTFTAPAAGRFGGMMWRVQNVHATQPHKQWHAYGPRSANVVTSYGMTTAIGNQPSEDSLYLVCCNLNVGAGQSVAASAGPSGMTVLTVGEFGLASGSRTGLLTWQQSLSPGPITESAVTLVVTPSGGAAASGVVLRKA